MKEIRQLYNLTQEELALALGITRELVNKMEKGKCPVSKGTKALLQNFLQDRSENISPEISLLGRAHHFPAKAVMPYFEQRRESKMNKKAPLEVPLVAQKAQAGYVKSYEQVDYLNTLEKYSLPPGVNGAGAVWSYFEVDGDSMEPTLYPGDLLLASMLPQEDWVDIKNLSVYVILTEDRLVVKRIFKKNASEWILISDNEDHHPQAVLPVSSVKQVWVFRRHIRSRVAPPKEFRITA